MRSWAVRSLVPILTAGAAFAGTSWPGMAAGPTGVGGPAATGAPAPARVSAYPMGSGAGGRFFVTAEKARPCALPPGVTGPNADGRVEITVTAVEAGRPAEQITGDALSDLTLYYANADTVVAGFSRARPAALARAATVAVDIECRGPDGSFTSAGGTGPVAVAAAPVPFTVSDPLTVDSQVRLVPVKGADGGAPDAAVDEADARTVPAGSDGGRGERRVLLPSGTGPGLHLLTMTFGGGGAPAATTVPIVNGYAPPSSGQGTLSDAYPVHGATPSLGGVAGGDAHSAHEAAARLVASTPDRTPRGGSFLLTILTVVLLGAAGGLVWLVYSRNGLGGPGVSQHS